MTNTASPKRQLPVIRVFVSSTFSDLVAERNALAEHVWPELEKFCRQRGFTFQAIDLRWGVPSEAGLDHRTMRICFEELRRAQETSPEPNFLVLLGNKYGWRPLPETISATEYAELNENALTPDEQATLNTWYRLVREHAWRRPRQRVHPAPTKVGIRAARPNQIWHMDTTPIRLLDGSRVYLQAVNIKQREFFGLRARVTPPPGPRLD